MYDSLDAKRGAKIEPGGIVVEGRAVIGEGRYRTPNRERQILMRDALKEKLRECPVHGPRSEVEALGAEIGVARIFDRFKGVSWRGDYVRSDSGWIAALPTTFSHCGLPV